MGVAISLRGSSPQSIRSLWVLVLASVLCGSWLVLGSRAPERLNDLGSSLQGSDSWGDRLPLWAGSIDQVSTWLWWGVGPGHSELLVASYMFFPSVLHNTLLSVAVEFGTFGLLSFLGIGLAAARVARKGANSGLFFTALVPTLLFMMTLSMEYYKMLWLLPALAAGGCLFQRDWDARAASSHGRRPHLAGKPHSVSAVDASVSSRLES